MLSLTNINVILRMKIYEQCVVCEHPSMFEVYNNMHTACYYTYLICAVARVVGDIIKPSLDPKP